MIRNIDINYIINNILNKISEKIINTINNNLNNYYIIKNIETFLSYYSWETKIEDNGSKNIRVKYPELYIKWINKSEDYINNMHSNNYKFILSKLIEIIKKKKRIENRLISINDTIKELKIKEQIINKKVAEKWKDIKGIENEIQNIRTKTRIRIKEKKKLNEILEKNTKIKEKIKKLLINKENHIEEKIKELSKLINLSYEDMSKLRFKLNTLNQEIKYIKQNNSVKKYIKEAIQIESELKKYTTKLEIIQKDLGEELSKRKKIM